MCLVHALLPLFLLAGLSSLFRLLRAAALCHLVCWMSLNHKFRNHNNLYLTFNLRFYLKETCNARKESYISLNHIKISHTKYFSYSITRLMLFLFLCLFFTFTVTKKLTDIHTEKMVQRALTQQNNTASRAD